MQYQIPHAGMSRTGDQIRSTIKTLLDSLPDPHMSDCLREARDPLGPAGVPPGGRPWWWAFAAEERKQHGLPPLLEQYQERERPPVTKCLVIAGLHRLVDGDGSGESVPDTDEPYTSAPRDKDKELPKSRVFATNPDKVDRGTTAHMKAEKALADWLWRAGLEPRKPKPGTRPQFDIAWRDDDFEGVAVAFIGEVKSLTDENETWQIRLAIGQVSDYVHTLDSRRKEDALPQHWQGVRAIRGVVVVEHQPKNHQYWMSLCEKLGIILTWPGKFDDMLANAH